MPFKWWTSITELDEHQARVIALDPVGQYLITGPPGSGKTNLLALRARYLRMSGFPNVVILTFTRSLTEFLKTGVGNYGLQSGVIKTYNSWARQLVREYDESIDEGETFEKARKNLLAALQQLKTHPNVEGAFDCILLDEAQDYTADEIDMLRYLSKNLYAAADADQRIYKGRHGLEALREFCVERELPYNYRNGPRICRVADALQNRLDSDSGLEATSNYSDPYVSAVEVVSAPNLAGQIENALQTVRLQLQAYPNEPIGILAFKNEVLKNVVDHLEQSDLRDLFQHQSSQTGYSAIDDERPIIVVTIHNAKGLEFRAVHLINSEDLDGAPLAKNLAYTAVTRAKTSLYLHHSDPMPGFLESAVASLESKESPSDLAALFGAST
jgi:superfamily I DNA/RNA helicase